jgi:hypothetical protein
VPKCPRGSKKDDTSASSVELFQLKSATQAKFNQGTKAGTKKYISLYNPIKKTTTSS